MVEIRDNKGRFIKGSHPNKATEFKQGETRRWGTNFIDRIKIGDKFGKLTIIEIKRKEGKIICKCECGNITTKNTKSLSYYGTTDCGCVQKAILLKVNTKAYGESSTNQIYLAYKFGARKKNPPVPFNLTKEQFKKITSKDCFYCGKKPNNLHKSKAKNNTGDFIYNGIDRIDNTKGYEENNVVPCCNLCNHMKWKLTQQQFLEHAKKIIEFQNKQPVNQQ